VPAFSAGVARADNPSDNVTVTFWTPLSDPLGSSLLLPYIHKFEQSHPGITVKFVGVPQDPNQGWTKYVTAMAAGRGPDLVLTTAYNPPIPEWATNNLIQPLDAAFKQLGVNASQFFPWVNQMQSYGGHAWGLVQEYDTTLFVWNKADFKAAGLNPNNPPRTIAELDADAQKLTKFDSSGNLVQAGMIPWLGQTGMFLNGTDQSGDPRFWTTLFGGSYYNEATKTYTINSPANIKAFDWIGSWAKKLGGAAKVNAFVSHFVGNNDPIYTGKVAMEFVGDWVPLFTFKPYGPKTFTYGSAYGVALPPTAPGVPYGTNLVIGSDTFAVPASAQHPKEATELMLYMLGKDPVLAWCIGEANVPPTKAAAFDPSYVKGVPYMASAVTTARTALTNPKVLAPFPTSPVYDYVQTQLSNAMQQVEFGQTTAQAALNNVQQVAQQRAASVKQ
jgi:multiple sugar transport system substrate-binding protein